MPRRRVQCAVNLSEFKMDCECCWDKRLFYCVWIDLHQGTRSECGWSQGDESYWDTKLFYWVWIDLIRVLDLFMGGLRVLNPTEIQSSSIRCRLICIRVLDLSKDDLRWWILLRYKAPLLDKDWCGSGCLIWGWMISGWRILLRYEVVLLCMDWSEPGCWICAWMISGWWITVLDPVRSQFQSAFQVILSYLA